MARFSFFFSSSTWVLPLLVLFSSVSSSSLCDLSHLHTEVSELGTHVKNCSDICPVSVTLPPRHRCDCFNVSVPPTDGSALNYFIEALNSMHSTIRSAGTTEYLMYRLQDCSKNIILETVTYEPILSPKGLHKKLDVLSQTMNAKSRTS